MKWIRFAAPLTALTLITSACGGTKPQVPVPRSGPAQPTDPAPSVSPAAGPALRGVWQSPANVDASSTKVVGNVVLTQATGNERTVAFIDGTTGRVKGRADIGNLLEHGAQAVTDGEGHSLVALAASGSGSRKETVYDTNGRLVWKAHTDYGTFAGGYTAESEGSATKARAVIRTRSGRVVARLPLSFAYRAEIDSIGLQVVRPGLLVVSGFGTDSSQVALLDVSRPGPARVTRLRTPFKPSVGKWATVLVTVSGEHLYVSWQPLLLARARIARYDVPGTEPVWQRFAPKGLGEEDAAIRAFPGANGGDDAVSLDDGGGSSERFWLLDPATGKPTGPQEGRDGTLDFVSDGHAYFRSDDSDWQRVLDLHTGKARTIDDFLVGATPNGNLVDSNANAYRWN